MKKIGLAVCHDSLNFGSQLQLIANARCIEELGYETEIVCYKKKVTPSFVAQNIPRLLNPRFVSAKFTRYCERKHIASDKRLKDNIQLRKKRFRNFAVNYYPEMSEPYVGWEMLVEKARENYDGFVCGSDQLWLPNNLESHFYTLEFAPDDKPKIAYATSFGVSTIPKRQEKKTAKYLNRFQSLSTRELAGSEIIKKVTGRVSSVVCDPTLLYDAESWERIIPSKRIVEEPYIFAYFLGNNEEHRRIAEDFRKETGLLLVTSPFLNHYVEYDHHFGDLQMYDMDSADFVNLIRHASYVLTDSFHGSVFSIINHRQFMTFDRYMAGANSRNSRIDSLCTLLDLKERRYTGNIAGIKNEIDYDSVDVRLKQLRNESLQYLKDALAQV